MTIHTIGDSHSSAGWKYCSNICSHHIGPVLAYSFGIKKLKVCDIRNFNIKDDDTIIFCFGEIDCRCHIIKHVSIDNTYKEIINLIINNYIDAIKTNINTCEKKLKNVCIYNVPPTIPKHRLPNNHQANYPLLGTDEERKKYGLYFNECLKKKCKENNWIFFDIYYYYIDKNGFLEENHSDGNVHIKNGKYLQNFINDHLL